MIKSAPITVLLAATLIGTVAARAAEMSVLEAGGLQIKAEVVADGLEHPWGLDFLPDGSLLVTERAGRLRIVRNGVVSEPVAGLPEVAVKGQGGLLDVLVAPDFVKSGLIYITFSEPGWIGAGTAVARARLVLDGGKAHLEDVSTIFSMEGKSRQGHHFGSRLAMNPHDGSLFFSIGDRGSGKRAQDPFDHAGAVLRINADGSIPADNPYADGEKALPQIWSKGHRNAQGMAWDRLTDSLLTVEHGAKGGDEVNRPAAGKNYGWPVISYGVNYDGKRLGQGTAGEGYEQPLFYWDPSIAPSGMVAYDGDMFPEWKGDLLIGSLKFELLSRLDRDANGAILGEERMLAGRFGRIRDVNQAPDGSILLLTDEADGAIIRLSRAD
ncbi:MAG: PQQ-dependent sugar dehydrogenase [Rhizobiaceae bacterium]|nr:PQQ-dependent sugar dehydrogenase [Rhizobiaceae bacterium]